MLSPTPSRSGLRCRQIADADLNAVAALLARGFRNRNRGFWLRALTRLQRREVPPGLPQYGYLLQSDGEIVGALLVICTAIPAGEAAVTRCNLSSWYVEPKFRAYASLLVAQATRQKEVTYLNVSPAPHTRPIIEAQGFSRYCDGVFIAVPMLNGLFGGERIKAFGAEQTPRQPYDPGAQELLRRHAALGCISLWCETSARAYPFVFGRRLIRNVVPCAQLVYCHDIDDFVRCAGPLGRYLARRGAPFVILDANGPVAGLAGFYRRGAMPKYFRGRERPRLGDLAYTEYAYLGL